MERWKQDIENGLKLLEKGIRHGLDLSDRVNSNRETGLIRMCILLSEEGDHQEKVRTIILGDRVKVKDHINGGTWTGEVTDLWCPYGFEMVEVRLSCGCVWFPMAAIEQVF